MNWGTELWDQFDKVTDHTQKGIEFCERYTHFIKDRAKIEADYANALRRLTKSYLPKKKEEESPFTVVKSFNDSLKEVADIAGQHELLVEQLKQKILDEMAKLMTELKIERKKHIEESKRLENQLQAQLRTLEQEQVRAEETFRNADANLNLSRAEVEKTKNMMHQKAQACSECKSSYALVLEQTNNHQRDYYNKLLPQVFQSMQELDEKRIIKIRESIKQMSDVERGIQPIINTCLDLISQSSEKVDHGEDSRRVIDRFKSGFVPPDDIAFEDLGNEDTKSIGSSNSSKTREPTIKSSSGTTKGPKKKEKGRLAGIFGGRVSNGLFLCTYITLAIYLHLLVH
ncbi:hypothetical protein EB796_022590 [Bugula neritina]|uniref:F-BAR domain-containing protein n=1 Tax=Bugula neritina TaxID=10212 RepID=A0A7J7IYV9_BUGNE|nr:hypothetical protein EB796_022590 [Bugula neritina]